MLGGGGGDANAIVTSTGEAAAATHRHTGGAPAQAVGAAAALSAVFGSISQDNNNSADEDPRGGRLEEGGGVGSFGGNRWPRQETLALLQIRSDMDAAFRDASVKGPLWEDVSRKMGDLGYHRSAKKCKEKFENVYKYHKRTKDGRTSKSDGKTYRFFDQLEALETQLSSPPSSRPQHHQQISLAPPPPATTAAQLIPPALTNNQLYPPGSCTTVPTTVPSTMSVPHTISFSTGAPQNSFSQAANTVIQQSPVVAAPPPASLNVPPLFGNSSEDLVSNSTSSSSSTSSDVQLEGRRKRKRKWKDFFERLMKGVIEKQEEMQKRFLETLERREQERMAREENWRMQEMAKINREREILAQERSMAAAKDTAVMTFLQKLSEQQNPSHPVQLTIPPPLQQPSTPAILTTLPTPKTPAPPQASAATAPAITPVSPPPQPMVNFGNSSLSVKAAGNGDPNSMTPASSSRWPKVEIEALIKLRTSMDAKYQENCPKGPLWEDISAAMRKLGYNRNAKRCKEKWENINKYFKKVKESNKKRPEDSKTCPYFHQLDALYSKRNKTTTTTDHHMGGGSSSTSQMKPENSVPLLVRPEQQWPPASVMEDLENEQMDEEEDDCEDDNDEEDDDQGGGGYEIVASKPAVAMGAGE